MRYLLIGLLLFNGLIAFAADSIPYKQIHRLYVKKYPTHCTLFLYDKQNNVLRADKYPSCILAWRDLDLILNILDKNKGYN